MDFLDEIGVSGLHLLGGILDEELDCQRFAGHVAELSAGVSRAHKCRAEHDTDVASSHEVHRAMFVDTMKVVDEHAQGVVVLRGQLLDQVSVLGGFVIWVLDHARIHEFVVEDEGHQWVWKRAEVRLEDRRDAADVVELLLVVQVE